MMDWRESEVKRHNSIHLRLLHSPFRGPLQYNYDSSPSVPLVEDLFIDFLYYEHISCPVLCKRRQNINGMVIFPLVYSESLMQNKYAEDLENRGGLCISLTVGKVELFSKCSLYIWILSVIVFGTCGIDKQF